MIRTTLTTTVLALTLLAGCGGGSDPEKAAPSKTTKEPASAIPSPSKDESIELVDQLDAIVPGAGQEAERTITRARDTCTSILGKSPKLEQSTVLRFSSSDQEITADQAEKIISVVKAAPWCTT